MEAKLATREEFIDGMTKKALQKMAMPPIGTKIADGSEVMYVNFGKFRFTAKSNELPEIGMIMEWKERVYKVCHLNEEKSRFSAEFVGFKKPAERPSDNDNNTAKLLEDEDIDDNVKEDL